ncbi:MAG TPA: ComEC/Rec2 family competence protein [Saprospiraceae bacterium]|nr:ComEC/Rec2 family competence protein [Saprospiraceae bacterium]
MKKADAIYNPQKYPMLLPSMAFILGIIIANFWTIKIGLPLAVIILAILVNFSLDKIAPKLFHKLAWQNGLLLLVFTCLGALRICIDDPTYNPNHMVHFIDPDMRQVELKGIVKEIESGEKTTKVALTITEVKLQEIWYEKKGKTILYLDSMPSDLQIFDETVCKVKIFPSPKANPHAFDYAKFLYRKDIHFTGYVSRMEDVTILKSRQIGLLDWPQVSRNYLNNRLSTLIQDRQAFALITAMLLGERNQLDKNTIAVFSNTGAIHVLAVSGLHVGILIHLLYLIMGLFRINNKIKLVIGISVGLCYALIVGAAPSIIRATLLISLILLGNYFKAYVNIYNLLSLVALIMLIIQPNDFFTVSFQFSFVAILSLALFTKPIYELVEFKYKLPQLLWKLLSSTLAAQILMTPMVIFYFHQFPVYFFLSCFVAIPLAYLGVVGGGIILLTSYIFPTALSLFIANMIGKAVSISYQLLEVIGKLPFALWDKLFLSLPSLMLITAIIFSLFAYLISKQKTYILVCNALLVLLVVDELMEMAQDHKTSSVTVYEMRAGSLIDIFDGNTCLTYKSVQVTPEAEKYAAENNRLAAHITEVKYVQSDKQLATKKWIADGNNFRNGHLNIKLINAEIDTLNFEKADILIVNANLRSFPITETKTVVIGNKVNYKTSIQIKKNCMNCEIWSVEENGYYFQVIN